MFGYDVAVQRDVLEFLDLVDVTADGLTVVGSGRVRMATAPRYDPGRAYELTGATAAFAVADEAGRLHLAVDLGPSHTAEQYSAAARAVPGPARLLHDEDGHHRPRTRGSGHGSDPVRRG